MCEPVAVVEWDAELVSVPEMVRVELSVCRGEWLGVRVSVPLCLRVMDSVIDADAQDVSVIEWLADAV